jgi:hypothetical protein
MIAPKFAVGEVVILQSVERPDLNGERSVLRVIASGEIYDCPLSGRGVRRVSEGFGYLLSGCGAIEPGGTACQWRESAIRKRHQPGEHAFDSLMASLNAPVSRDELARLDREVVRG